MNGIDGVSVMDNIFDVQTQKYGDAQFTKAESTTNNQLPIDTLTKRGNRNLYEKPIQTLLDDFHDWGSQQTLSANNGYPLPGTIRFSDPATGILTGTGVDLRDELRPGDLLATDNLGAIGAPAQAQEPPLPPLPALSASGPFYVKAVNKDTGLVTLARVVTDTTFTNRALLPVRRYRGPMAYFSNPPAPAPAVLQPVFNVLNDGSVVIGDIPATFGLGGPEFYVNGKATITGQLRAGEGSAAVPAVSFTADTGTGFFHPATDTVGVVTSGVERARVTSSGLQLGNLMSLGFGTSTAVSDTFLMREAGVPAATLALSLQNGLIAQTFRVYENYGSSVNYSRLSFKTQAGNYQIRSEAGGTGTLRSLQVGTGPKTGTNQNGLDTILHGGMGTGNAPGGAILFQYSPTGSSGSGLNNLATAWQIGPTGHLMAYDSTKMVKWGASYNSPAIKGVIGTNPELQIRKGDDSSGAALLFRLSVAPKAATYAVNESESNRTFTNEGANGAVTFTLPSGYTTNIGFHCHFAVVAGQTFTIAASGSDTIRIGTQKTPSGQSGSINASTIGNAIHLVCTGLNTWVALSREGTWNGVS